MLKTKEHECKEIMPAETPLFYNTADKVLNLIYATLKEAKFIITIVMDLNVIPLALQITCLAGIIRFNIFLFINILNVTFYMYNVIIINLRP